MPRIRLNKAVKELNISISRAVEYLQSKGIEIDSNPNAILENEAFSALESEFSGDAEQKKASHEVVISKVPEERLEIIKEVEPDIIRAKATPQTGAKILGKINLEETLKPKIDHNKKEKTRESKSNGNKKSKTSIISDAKEIRENKEARRILDTNKQIQKPEVQKNKKISLKGEDVLIPAQPEKIETIYQKLDGPKILQEKVDLSQFQKPKKVSSENPFKKKRKRITKEGTKTGATQTTGQNSERKPFNRTAGQNQGNRGGGNKRGDRRGKPMPVELTDEQVKNQIKETLEKLTSKGGKSKGSKHRRDKRSFRRERDELKQELQALDKTLKATEFITVSELASLMDVSPTEVISACFSLGVMVTMNQRLEADTLTLVADEFGYKVEFSDADIDDASLEEEMDSEEDLNFRAPIVTVMGHVDHGKTSLLDYIRKTNVIAGESGGITQHIGAYNVKLDTGDKITFLDTPGHEAFTAMRARGTQITDIAIIVIAADDDVMPQTREAIAHAQAAGVPMIIAINKVDKQGANPDKIREQLSGMNILVEEWGGNVQSQEISAKFGNNVDLLLEKILIQAEMLDLKANPNKKASGVVIEAALDKGRGYIATILVQNGTLKVGDYVLAGKNHGKVKAMLDERGKPMLKAKPSMPTTILGLDGSPTAGDKFRVFDDEREAKTIATKREQLHREQAIRTKKHLTLDEIGRRIALGDFKELNIILKGDVDGSVEALSDMLEQLSTEEIHVNILHKGVGQITESDVLLASASDAVIIGFNVRAGVNAKGLAEKEEIEIRTYSVIYDAIDEIKEAMEGMLSPEIKEKIVGNVEIRETFKISKIGTIAGCMVTSGKINRNSKIRLIRNGIVQYTGELESLKRFKDDVKEVTKGYECGLNIKDYNNLEIGDMLEVYEEFAVKRKL